MSLSITNESYNLTLPNNGKQIVVKAKTLEDITVYMYKNQKLQKLDGTPKTPWEMSQLRLLCGQAEESTVFHLFVLFVLENDTTDSFKLQELRSQLLKQNIKFTFVVIESDSEPNIGQLLNVGFMEIYNTWKKGKQTDFYIPYFCTIPKRETDMDFRYPSLRCFSGDTIVFDYLSFLRTNGYSGSIHKINYRVLSKKKVNDVIWIKIF